MADPQHGEHGDRGEHLEHIQKMVSIVGQKGEHGALKDASLVRASPKFARGWGKGVEVVFPIHLTSTPG